MINILTDGTNKVIGFYGTDIQMATVDEIPEQPSPKPGINHVMYYDPETKKIVLKEETRPLTETEESAKKQAELETQVLSLMEVLADIHEGGGA